MTEVLADRFVLERLAGRGGMGKVYRALDGTTGQRVAVKLLLDQEEAQLARFEREARILAELAHPLIVRYVAHGVVPTGEPFLAMEWLEGHDLASRLALGPLEATEGIALVLSVAEALAVLHEREIVHRDLKPSNIFLVEGRTDRVKLLDFGLAWVGDDTRMTRTGTVLGTVHYMAPEQARGEQEIDARADVFSLGCVLFECLIGELPFAADHPTAVLMKLLFEEAPRLADRRPGLPAELGALVARMLAKDAAERPRDARAVAGALRTRAAERLGPRFALGVSSPTGWLVRSFGASLSVGIDRHHAIRANIARSDPSLLPILFAITHLEEVAYLGRSFDASLGWVYYPRRLWDGFMLEAGVLRRDRDVQDFRGLIQSSHVAIQSVTHSGRVTIGWSWPLGRHLFVSAAAGVSVGRETGTYTVRSDSEMRTSALDRLQVDPEVYLRFGLRFGR